MTAFRRTEGVPTWAIVVAGVGILFVLVPLVGILTHVEWASFPALVTSTASVDALRLSLVTSALATLLCLLLGTPMALLLSRVRFPGRALVRALVLLPLVLPPVVGGIALLYTYGRRGLIGPAFEALGIPIAFSTAAVVLAQTFVALPFLVISVEGALAGRIPQLERVAATLGASPSRVLLRVTLPAIRPALVSGAILAFARALGEFGATITFAGSLQGVTQTLPLELYFRLTTEPAAAVALSLLLVAASVAIVGVAYRSARGRVLS